MKKSFILLGVLLPFMVLSQKNEDINIIPAPVSVQRGSDKPFVISPATTVTCGNSSLVQAAALLNLYLKQYTGIQLATDVKNNSDYILLQVDTILVSQKEGYIFTATGSSITITGNSPAGVIYGIQTLRQLWQQKDDKHLVVPAANITDYPRFGYRGMHLDVSRHFFPAPFIKKYIDLLALYKLNTFHWHLTDDQGWRVEIKKYPRLQTVAAWRDATLLGHKKELPHTYDGKKYGGYYTQDEIRDIVQYAASRNITIIPEIEMPGHALAALTAYPSLGCTGGPYKTAQFWGVFDDVFCAGNDSVFVFMQNVLDEVMALFPSKYIHVGGDECPKTRWKTCPKCQARIKALGLKDEHELQSYFVQRMEKYINSKGRNIIGWDEILEGGLAPNAAVMSWRGEEGGVAAVQQKHNVIMTPESHLYFDYYQSLYPQEQLADGGFTPLSKVYSYEPVKNDILNANAQYVLGVQAQLWTEYVPSPQVAEYMLMPRMMALAELAWSPAGARDYSTFLQHVRAQRKMLQRLHVNYADNFDEITFTATQPVPGKTALTLATSLPGAEIRYTTNGIIPGLNSPLYTQPIEISRSATLNAIVYYKGKPTGRMFSKAFTMHKATGAHVTLTNHPIERFNPGAQALVNGITASNLYNDGQWVGMSGDDLVAVIELDSVQSINSIGINVLNYHWQRIWAHVSLVFYTSIDGVKFNKVFEQDTFAVNGINTVKALCKNTKVKYIKVAATNKGIIPVGEYGSGGKALLLADEITVE